MAAVTQAVQVSGRSGYGFCGAAAARSGQLLHSVSEGPLSLLTLHLREDELEV